MVRLFLIICVLLDGDPSRIRHRILAIRRPTSPNDNREMRSWRRRFALFRVHRTFGGDQCCSSYRSYCSHFFTHLYRLTSAIVSILEFQLERLSQSARMRNRLSGTEQMLSSTLSSQRPCRTMYQMTTGRTYRKTMIQQGSTCNGNPFLVELIHTLLRHMYMYFANLQYC